MPSLSVADRAPPTGVLRQALVAVLGQEVTALHRQRSPFWSDFHTEKIQVRLASGRPLSIFFKDFDVVRVPREEPLDFGRREFEVYRLLAGVGVTGIPALYGAVWDRNGGHHWIFLEDVGDWPLRHGARSDWINAVRWLGRLHARFADREQEVVAAVPGMTRFGMTFVEDTARRATQRLAELGAGGGDLPALRQRDADRLRPVVEAFRSVAASELSGPATLLHGDCYGYNVLLRPAGDARQSRRWVCFVDWEMAWFGPAALDLAALMLGAPRGTPALLTTNYLDAFARAGGGKLRRSSFELALGSFAVWDLVAELAALDVDAKGYAGLRRRLGLPGRLAEAEQFLRTWGRGSRG